MGSTALYNSHKDDVKRSIVTEDNDITMNIKTFERNVIIAIKFDEKSFSSTILGFYLH